MSKSIVQELTFDAPPRRVYQAYVSSKQHAAFTGGPAEISAEAGGEFSCHGGQIVGRNVELAADERIVQAWRVAGWPPGLYTLVRIDLAAEGDGTKLTLTHSGVPDEFEEHLAGGWHQRYWEPLARYLRR